MIPAWVADYVNIPFKNKGRDRTGADCYGLCRLVALEHDGVLMPSYLDQYEDANYERTAHIVSDLSRLDFIKVPNPEVGAMVVLLVKGLPWHVGRIVSEDFHFLHTMRRLGSSVIEQLYTLTWPESKIVGFYRYARF
jgi:hypothetical protein